MERDTPSTTASEALARAKITEALASRSGTPLAAAADLLVATVLDDPDWRSVIEGWPNNELVALARLFPEGSAALALRKIDEMPSSP